MAGFFPLKMKRKELEEVNEDFSDFSLSSPARKIRRLDAELPPIIEEEPEDPVNLMAEEYVPSNLRGSGPVIIEELPENEERAIVLYNSANNTPLLQFPSNYYSVDPKILSGLKNKLVWSSQSNVVVKSCEDEAAARHDDSDATTSKGCLAVVPWVPSLLSSSPEQTEVSDIMMDAEDTEATRMDIEEEDIATNIMPGQGFGYNRGSEGVLQQQQQQQQQHCMFPELPQSTSTPVVWFQ